MHNNAGVLTVNKLLPVFFLIVSQQEHTGRVFRLQFDDFQIVSSSHDDTILIWDFLDTPSGSVPMETGEGSSSSEAAAAVVPQQEVGGGAAALTVEHRK